MRRAVVATIAVALAGSFGACKEEPAPDPLTDRTLQKLKEEVDRANRGEPVGQPPDAVAQDPNAKLAQLAAQDDAPKPMRLPEKNDTVHLGTLALKLAELNASHSVKMGRIELTSEDVFLGVKLLAQNVGKEDVRMTLAYATVKDAAGKLYPIAPDAQRAAGSKELAREWKVDVRDEVTLYFEVPSSAIGKGLKLEFPGMESTGFHGVTLPLD